MVLTTCCKYSVELKTKRRLTIFATRCLEFIVPAQVRQGYYTTAVVEFYLDFELNYIKKQEDSGG